MWELRTLELLIALFLLLPLIRPFFKRLWTMDGLTILPLLALGTGAGIFPAYGVRPECLPLVVYAVFLNIANLPALSGVLRQLKNDDFRDRSLMGTGFLVALLAAVTALAVCFAPPRDTAMTDSGTRSATVRDETRNVELFLRSYAPEIPGAAEKRPLMILIPPATGSLPVVDRLCGALARRGFTVLAYSRQGIDAPALRPDGKRRLLSPLRGLRRFRAMFQGTRWAAANAIGRGLEEERKQDLAFLLSSLQNRGGLTELLPGNDTDRNLIFVAGYGAGGAAAVLLASETGFAERNPAVRGIIGLESPILSMLGQGAAKRAATSRGQSGWFFLVDLGEKIAALAPKRIRGFDRIPQPELPVLFILSDRALSYSPRREYLSVLETYRRAAVPAALVMVPGAGPLDYSDVPEKYPLLSRLFPGEAKPLWAGEEYPGGTASLIANFCATLVENRAVPRMPLDSALHVEVNGAWNFAAPGYILDL
jgi:dienelactone hydrolase